MAYNSTQTGQFLDWMSKSRDGQGFTSDQYKSYQKNPTQFMDGSGFNFDQPQQPAQQPPTPMPSMMSRSPEQRAMEEAFIASGGSLHSNNDDSMELLNVDGSQFGSVNDVGAFDPFQSIQAPVTGVTLPAPAAKQSIIPPNVSGGVGGFQSTPVTQNEWMTGFNSAFGDDNFNAGLDINLDSKIDFNDFQAFMSNGQQKNIFSTRNSAGIYVDENGLPIGVTQNGNDTSDDQSSGGGGGGVGGGGGAGNVSLGFTGQDVRDRFQGNTGGVGLDFTDQDVRNRFQGNTGGVGLDFNAQDVRNRFQGNTGGVGLDFNAQDVQNRFQGNTGGVGLDFTDQDVRNRFQGNTGGVGLDFTDQDVRNRFQGNVGNVGLGFGQQDIADLLGGGRFGDIGLGFGQQDISDLLGGGRFGDIGLGFGGSQIDDLLGGSRFGDVGLGFGQDDISRILGDQNIGDVGLGFGRQDITDIFKNQNVGFDTTGLTFDDVGFDTTGLNIPDIGISKDALLGLQGFSGALNNFGNFNMNQLIEAQLAPFVTGLGGSIQDFQDLIDQQSNVIPKENGFSASTQPTAGGAAVNEKAFIPQDFGQIIDDRGVFQDALLNQILGNTGAQDLVGSEFVGRLDASNPFAQLSQGDNSILSQVEAQIARQAQRGRDQLLNQFGVTNKLDQPIFKEQMQNFEGRVLDSESNAAIQFGLQEAGAEEGLRRNRLSDLLGFNQGVTNNLGTGLQQATQNFTNDVNLRSQEQNNALQDFINQISFNNAATASQSGFSDSGLALALQFLGQGSAANTGSQAANVFGNIAGQQTAARANSGGGTGGLNAILSNPNLFKRD